MAIRGRPKVEWVTVSCANCGVSLERRKSDMARRTTGRVFCSKECQHQLGSKPRMKADATCETCGKVFYPINAGPNRFCSKACHDQEQRKDRIQATCETCGKAFELRPSQANYRRYRFCSKACEGRALWRRPLERMHNGKPALITVDGYVKVWEPTHARYANASGWIAEHRLVMEQLLGRPLVAGEHIHHINGDKADNRPENLTIMSPGDHASLTGYERAAKERAQREALEAELERYRRLYGPLPPEGT